MKKIFSYRVKYIGLNFIRYLNELIKYNIQIYNIDKKNSKEILFWLSAKNYKKLKSLKLNSNIKIEHGGLKSIVKKCTKRIGILVGVILCIFCSIITYIKIPYSIQIIGSKNFNNEIKNLLNRFNYLTYKEYDFNNEKIEQTILDNIDGISLVSVKLQGNVLLINVVEKENSPSEFEPFYAPYNMVIHDLELISGTPIVSKNSVVKKGDILVEPYTISSNGERLIIPAKAKIIADIWHCGSEEVFKEKTISVPTDVKKVYKNIYFLKNKNKEIMSPYHNYMSESVLINVSNIGLLPIYLHKTTFIKMEKKTEIFDFENNKDIYLEKSKQKAYTYLPKNVIIHEISQNISELSDRYIFQTYIRTTMEINNEN